MALVAALNFYWYVMFAAVISTWLVSLNIINFSNPNVRQIYFGLQKATAPVLRPIQKIMPDLGGLDISPIVPLLGIPVLINYIDKFSRTLPF